MSALEPVFTKPAFITCIRLVMGWILCPARRSITGMYPFADPKRENRVDVYHYFFCAASWRQCELFACWARFLVGRLCAGRKTLLLAVDDTVHKKTGRKVDGAIICRDAVRSTTSETAFCRALQYVPLCLIYHPPWGGEPLAIPLNIRLNRKNRQGILNNSGTYVIMNPAPLRENSATASAEAAIIRNNGVALTSFAPGARNTRLIQ
jgi:hypothetical protein